MLNSDSFCDEPQSILLNSQTQLKYLKGSSKNCFFLQFHFKFTQTSVIDVRKDFVNRETRPPPIHENVTLNFITNFTEDSDPNFFSQRYGSHKINSLIPKASEVSFCSEAALVKLD